jgi:hypothetical protein
MPDVDGNGPHSVESWSLVEYAGNNQWSREKDIYDPETMLTRRCHATAVTFVVPEFGT